MPTGAGVYDAEARTIAEANDASMVVVIVQGGARGDGFSIVVADDPSILETLPALLRSWGDAIEPIVPADLRELALRLMPKETEQ
jgi:hypothetical protein